MFAIFLQLTVFIFIFLDAEFKLRVSEIVGKKYQKMIFILPNPFCTFETEMTFECRG
jgi:hypothetical protein